MASPAQSFAFLDFEGQRYRIEHPRSFGVEDEFSAWLEAEAYAKIEILLPRMKQRLGDARALQWYHQALARTDVAIASQTYSWGAPACRAAMYSDLGLEQLVHLQLQAGEQQGLPVALELAERMLQDPATRARLERIIWELPAEGADPNAGSPATGSSSTITSAPSSRSAATDAPTSAGSTAVMSPACSATPATPTAG